MPGDNLSVASDDVSFGTISIPSEVLVDLDEYEQDWGDFGESSETERARLDAAKSNALFKIAGDTSESGNDEERLVSRDEIFRGLRFGAISGENKGNVLTAITAQKNPTQGMDGTSVKIAGDTSESGNDEERLVSRDEIFRGLRCGAISGENKGNVLTAITAQKNPTQGMDGTSVKVADDVLIGLNDGLESLVNEYDFWEDNPSDREDCLTAEFEAREAYSRSSSSVQLNVFTEVISGGDGYADCVFTAGGELHTKYNILDWINTCDQFCTKGTVRVPNRMLRGSYTFSFHAKDAENIGDLTIDHLSPWTRTKTEELPAMNPKVVKFGVCQMDGLFYFEDGSKDQLIINSATLPRERSIKRKVAFVRRDNDIVSNVMVIYTIGQNSLPLPIDTAHVSVKPSVMLQVRDAFKHRNMVQARHLLQDQGIKVPTRTLNYVSRTVETSNKIPSGPTVVTDTAKIEAMTLCDRYLTRFSYVNGSGKGCVRIISINPDAVRAYASGCPTEQELLKHQLFVDELATCDVNTQKELICSLMKATNNSGALPKLGSCLQIDTTFSLCELHVTPVLGMLEDFVNVSEGKQHVICCGYMLHTEKKSFNHKAFGKAFAHCMKKFAPRKRVPCVLMDGERGLRKFVQGDCMSLAQRLGCDIHMRGAFESDDKKVSDKDEAIYRKLFGKINSDGFWKGGALAAMTEEKFSHNITEVMLSSSKTRRLWLREKLSQLWEEHSLFAKLRGGLIQQYTSTNVAEAYNSVLKRLIPAPLPGEKLLPILKRQGKDDISNLVNAVTGMPDRVRVAGHAFHRAKSRQEWETMPYQDRVRTLASFGLEGSLPPEHSLGFELPECLLYRGSRNKDRVARDVSQLDVEAGKLPNTYFVYNPRDLSCVSMITLNAGRPKCSLCHSPSFSMCVHELRCLQEMQPVAREELFTEINTEWEKQTAKQIMKRTVTANDAKKVRRKFGKLSKANYPRTLKEFSNVSALFDDSIESMTVPSSGESCDGNAENSLPLPNHLIRKSRGRNDRRKKKNPRRENRTKSRRNQTTTTRKRTSRVSTINLNSDCSSNPSFGPDMNLMCWSMNNTMVSRAQYAEDMKTRRLDDKSMEADELDLEDSRNVSLGSKRSRRQVMPYSPPR